MDLLQGGTKKTVVKFVLSGICPLQNLIISCFIQTKSKPHKNLTKCKQLHYDKSDMAHLSRNECTNICFNFFLFPVIQVTNSNLKS